MRGLKKFLLLLTAAVLLLNVGVASVLAMPVVDEGSEEAYWLEKLRNGTAAIECGGTIYGYTYRTSYQPCYKNEDGLHRSRTWAWCKNLCKRDSTKSQMALRKQSRGRG